MLKIALCLVAVHVVLAEHSALEEMNSLSFTAWLAKFSKRYTSEEERAAREVVYLRNQFMVQQHNAANHSWTMALNEFADLTTEEFSLRLGLAKGATPVAAPQTHIPSGAAPADSVDWRAKNAVTPVKNQGSCGSCWAFSTVVSLEGQAAVKTGNLTSFSEEDLVDCVKNTKINGSSQVCCDGCQGGLMDYAFAYMIAKQGGKDDTESAYPYRGMGGKCKFSPSTAGPATVKSYTDIQHTEDDLKDAVSSVGPISIGVDASIGWQLYFGGVMDPWPVVGCSSSPKKMDHGVAVVGYGSASKDYWIIKNSWGSGWGEKGYMRLVRGKNACGITNNAVYPNLE